MTHSARRKDKESLPVPPIGHSGGVVYPGPHAVPPAVGVLGMNPETGLPPLAAIRCPQVPVLSILELASRDHRQRPLTLFEEIPGESAAVTAHLDEVRRHLEEERCPICRRWYRNASHAYQTTLKEQFRPFSRTPQRIKDNNELEYRLTPSRRAFGLAALEGRLLWRIRKKTPPSWSCLVRFGSAASDLSCFANLDLLVAFQIEKKKHPHEVRTRLTHDVDRGLTATVEPIPIASPDRVERVRFQPLAHVDGLDLG
jgi:hypothetical protein